MENIETQPTQSAPDTRQPKPLKHLPPNRMWRQQYSIKRVKTAIKVGADSTEGYSIKAIMSLSIMEVLQARLCPDEG